MQFATILLFASLALTGFAAPNAKRTIAQLEADIATASAELNALDTAITGFPNVGGSSLAALAIHADAVALGASLDVGTTDVEATAPVSESDGQMFLAALQAIEPKILDSLNQIVDKRPSFAALLMLSGVLNDLKNLQTSALAAEAASLAAAPDDLKAQAAPIIDAINAGFSSAIAAYS